MNVKVKKKEEIAELREKKKRGSMACGRSEGEELNL